MEIENISQRAIGMIEVKEKLEAIKKEQKELNFRSEKVLEYLNEHQLLKAKDFEAKKLKLEELGLLRLTKKIVIKILDTQPREVESLKAILAGEDITLKQDDLTKIIEAIK
jgi:DNA-directed RNA polymerase subunit F